MNCKAVLYKELDFNLQFIIKLVFDSFNCIGKFP